jgi:hypothetical protein
LKEVDGGKGCTPVNGCHPVRSARFGMSSVSRDRVTIDLRGIGPLVRAAASARRLRVAAYARLALAKASEQTAAPSLPACQVERAGAVTKITLRLDPIDAELLLLGAAQVGLSYGAFVGRLLRGMPLPPPLADRVKDRDALIVSSDHLATLSADLAYLIRMLKRFEGDGAVRYGTAAQALMADVRQHLALASRVVTRNGAER